VAATSKPFPQERIENILRAPCFDRVGCDRAGYAGKRMILFFQRLENFLEEGARCNAFCSVREEPVVVFMPGVPETFDPIDHVKTSGAIGPQSDERSCCERKHHILNVRFGWWSQWVDAIENQSGQRLAAQ
jgi:hypothetical protein